MVSATSRRVRRGGNLRARFAPTLVLEGPGFRLLLKEFEQLAQRWLQGVDIQLVRGATSLER